MTPLSVAVIVGALGWLWALAATVILLAIFVTRYQEKDTPA